MADWVSSLVEVLCDPARSDDVENFFPKIRQLVTTKEILLRILTEVDWKGRSDDLIRLCVLIDEIRAGKPSKFMGVTIATDPCTIEFISDWKLRSNITGIKVLLKALNVDAMYNYYSDHTEMHDIERRFTNMHQNLLAYKLGMSPTELKEWADDLPTMERDDLSGSDPHPVFVRAHSISRYLSVPSWVVPGPRVTLDKLPALPRPSEAMSLVDDTIIDLKQVSEEKYDEAKLNLRCSYQMMPYARKCEFLNKPGKKTIYEEIDDTVYFQNYGPVNTGDSDAVECLSYGGCRMMLCNCQVEGQEGWDSEEDMVYKDEEWEERDWFTGSCQVCDSQIGRREYALRIPSESGGWYGCCCSWNCIDSINTTDMELEMLNIMKDQLESTKIHI